MRRGIIAGLLLLCLLSVSSIACDIGGTEDTGQQLAEVTRGDLIVTVSGSGTIGVANERNLSFSSGGKIDVIYVEEGDKVNRGDMLAKLDTRTLELALAQQKAALLQATLFLFRLAPANGVPHVIRRVHRHHAALAHFIGGPGQHRPRPDHHCDDEQQIQPGTGGFA